MPYLIGHTIHERLPALWGETSVFSKKNLFSIEDGKLPPVHYDSVTMASHSLTHIESESHVVKDGETVDQMFQKSERFFGPTLVLRLKGNGYVPFSSDGKVFVWEVTKDELEYAINTFLNGKSFPGKLILTSDLYPTNEHGYHDPNYVMVLSPAAAEYLVGIGMNLYGTSWKSSDYKPGSAERPVHKILLKKAAILECLDVKNVPEGIYFLSAFPLKIEGASESPCFPVLFTKDEMF